MSIKFNPLNTKDVYVYVDALNISSTEDVYIRPTKTFSRLQYWDQVVQISDQGRIYSSRLALFWAPAMQRKNDMPVPDQSSVIEQPKTTTKYHHSTTKPVTK